jgi:hypothetical protein
MENKIVPGVGYSNLIFKGENPTKNKQEKNKVFILFEKWNDFLHN